MKYQVIDPEGVLIGGKRYREGETLPESDFTSSQIRAFVRFQQIKEVERKPAPTNPPKEPTTVDDLKAALNKLGIKFPEDAKKIDLEKLYAKSKASS